MFNEQLFVQVMAALVSNRNDIVWLTVCTIILGLTLLPCAKILKSSLQVANETTHRLRSNCGMTVGFCITGATNPESPEIGEISFCCISLSVVYLLGQYFLIFFLVCLYRAGSPVS